MEGDLLGFDGPFRPDDQKTQAIPTPPQHGNGLMAPSSDFLSASQQPQQSIIINAVVSSTETVLSESGHVTVTPTTATTIWQSSTDNASASRPLHQTGDHLLHSNERNMDTSERQESVNLINFGGSNDNVGISGTAVTVTDLKSTQPKELDVFDAVLSPPTSDANPLNHQDSSALVIDKSGGLLSDRFMPSVVPTSTTNTPVTNTVTPALTSDAAVVSAVDPFHALSSATMPLVTLSTDEDSNRAKSNDRTSQPDRIVNITEMETLPSSEQQSLDPIISQSSVSIHPTRGVSDKKDQVPPEQVDTTDSDHLGQATPDLQSTYYVITDTLKQQGNKTSNERMDPESSGNLVAADQRKISAILDAQENGEGDKDTGINNSTGDVSSALFYQATPTKHGTIQETSSPVKHEIPQKIKTVRLIPPSPAPDISDQATLRQHIQLLEKELHAAHAVITQLQHYENVAEERPGDAVMVEIQANLQNELNRRAEAEDKLRMATTECQLLSEEYKTFQLESQTSLDRVTKELEMVKSEKAELLKEVEQIREARDEQARKEMALTTRLNAAKKKEAVKANAAEHYEDQVEHLQQQLEEYKNNLESVNAERDQMNQELLEWKTYAEKRTKQLETALNDEKKLNDERKRKMKGFVEAKTEEVRAAKAEYISLQTELDQTSHSLKELNQRYKQLHAQWVQSQTRNRELQRDMAKLKKDSEKMLKAGGTLEARLSRSAQESEDHKNKRIQAKHELMSVLSQLEAERAVNARLQESIKMTFTPKALSQQQTIKEAIDEFEGALQRLSIRLGRPLPPPPLNSSHQLLLADPMGDRASDDGSVLTSEYDTLDDDDIRSGASASTNLSEINTNKVMHKLEVETQRVSRSIVSFSTSVERMHALLEGAGPRNCVDVFSHMFLNGGNGPNEETAAITGNGHQNIRNTHR
jgi:hypothetical protein